MIPGTNKIRKRLENSDSTILEWDYQHGKVEKYNKRGQHLGEFDAETGVQSKPADPARRIEP
ncbi:Colicin-E3 [compost metagenome]